MDNVLDDLVVEQCHNQKSKVVDGVASKFEEQLGEYIEGSCKLNQKTMSTIQHKVNSQMAMQDHETSAFKHPPLVECPPTPAATEAESSGRSRAVQDVKNDSTSNRPAPTDIGSAGLEVTRQHSTSARSDTSKHSRSNSSKKSKRTRSTGIVVEVNCPHTRQWTPISYKSGRTQQNWVTKAELTRLDTDFTHRQSDPPYSEPLENSRLTSCGTKVLPIRCTAQDTGALGKSAPTFQVAVEDFDGGFFIGHGLANQLKVSHGPTTQMPRLQLPDEQQPFDETSSSSPKNVNKWMDGSYVPQHTLNRPETLDYTLRGLGSSLPAINPNIDGFSLEENNVPSTQPSRTSTIMPTLPLPDPAFENTNVQSLKDEESHRDASQPPTSKRSRITSSQFNMDSLTGVMATLIFVAGVMVTLTFVAIFNHWPTIKQWPIVVSARYLAGMS